MPGIDFPGFDRERVTPARLKPELLKSAEGQFVALVGDELVGPVESPARPTTRVAPAAPVVRPRSLPGRGRRAAGGLPGRRRRPHR